MAFFYIPLPLFQMAEPRKTRQDKTAPKPTTETTNTAASKTKEAKGE